MASDRERIRAVNEVLHPKPKAPKTIPYREVIEDTNEFVLPEAINFKWNPDGTLNSITGSTFHYTFVWGSDGNVQRIIKG